MHRQHAGHGQEDDRPGSQYIFTTPRTRRGSYLDGAKNYKMNIPGQPAGKGLLVDHGLRSADSFGAADTAANSPAGTTSVDKLITNADGSVDLYFGPKAPAGKEANWIQTVPGKGWFAYLRLYGPLEPWFDKTWRPGEIELVK